MNPYHVFVFSLYLKTQRVAKIRHVSHQISEVCIILERNMKLTYWLRRQKKEFHFYLIPHQNAQLLGEFITKQSLI